MPPSDVTSWTTSPIQLVCKLAGPTTGKFSSPYLKIDWHLASSISLVMLVMHGAQEVLHVQSWSKTFLIDCLKLEFSPVKLGRRHLCQPIHQCRAIAWHAEKSLLLSLCSRLNRVCAAAASPLRSLI